MLLLISAIAFGFYGRYSQRYQVEMEAGNLTSTGDQALGQILADLRLAGYPPAFTVGIAPSPMNLYGPAYTGTSDNLVARGFNWPGGVMTATAASFEAALGDTGTTPLGVNGLIVDQVSYTLAAMNAGQTANCTANPQYPAGTLWSLSRSVTPKTAAGGVGATITRTVLDHIFSANGNAPSVFSYDDAGGNVTANPAAVAQIRVALVLQTCSGDLKNGLPVQLPFSGTAYIRNLGQ
ncbi:MAG: hypothetical protein ACRD2H_12810 [Terriglobales bacterium]